MTQQKALKEAQKLWGQRAVVQASPKQARIGSHGEYIPSHGVSNRKDSPKNGRYRCQRCSTADIDERGDLILRDVWHVAGGWQTSYKVGTIDLSMFFNVRGEGESFEAALAQAAPAKAAA